MVSLTESSPGVVVGAVWMKEWERSTDRSRVRSEQQSESISTGDFFKALQRRLENIAKIKREVKSKDGGFFCFLIRK